MMLNSNSIGNKIVAARKKMSLSQAELAMQLSISSQAVGKWERGESMPDIFTLNRLAEILGVDLNYFSDTFHTENTEAKDDETLPKDSPESTMDNKKNLNWDMSKLNLVDSDFSGLKNLHEKFSSSNMQRCIFMGANMSGLQLNRNNVDGCDFTNSNISNSQIVGSNLGANTFKNSSLKGTEFSKNNINANDFADADFTKAVFKSCNFMKNTVENAKWLNTSFIETQIQDVIFEGIFDSCSFENCSFYGVKFQNATLTDTFFKNNRKFKRVQFINCAVDKITYAFLKSNQANLDGVSLLS